MNAALFPGQGSQHVGMGKELYGEFPFLKMLFEEAEDILKEPLRNWMFEGGEEELRHTQRAQPCLFVTSMAIMQVLAQECGVHAGDFAYMAGHSLGEYSALCAAGCLSFSTTLTLIKERGRIMARAPQGAMAAILGLTASDVQGLIAQMDSSQGICEVANDNSPQQVVVSGEMDALNILKSLAYDCKALKVVFLNVSGAFHSSLMRPAQTEFASILEAIEFAAPVCPVISNVSAESSRSPLELKKNLSAQMAHPVLWRMTLLYLQDRGVQSIVEVGPGKVLCGLAKKTIPLCTSSPLGDFSLFKQWINKENDQPVSLAI
jgi:[acyl-carrier-protein] S-malonyltransferase